MFERHVRVPFVFRASVFYSLPHHFSVVLSLNVIVCVKLFADDLLDVRVVARCREIGPGRPLGCCHGVALQAEENPLGLVVSGMSCIACTTWTATSARV